MKSYLVPVMAPSKRTMTLKNPLSGFAKGVIAAVTMQSANMGRIHFAHVRNIKILEDGSFEESGHLSCKGSLDVVEILKAYYETGFKGYLRPDHGR